MILSLNGSVVEDVNHIRQRYAGKSISIAIDSSKSNTGIAIGDECCDLIDYLELNGSKDGTTQEDTLILCQREREAMSVIFDGANIKYCGIENIITKYDRSGKKETGITVHQSRFKITAVFMSFISFFQDKFNVTPLLINNQTWKSHTIPEEYRTRDYDKASIAYFRAIHSKYAMCSNDVTDAMCILMYMKKYYNISNIYSINDEIESKMYNMKIILFSSAAGLGDVTKMKFFNYNPKLTLEHNAVKIANRLPSDKLGIARVKTADVGFGDIYKYAYGAMREKEDELILAVRRI